MGNNVIKSSHSRVILLVLHDYIIKADSDLFNNNHSKN